LHQLGPELELPGYGCEDHFLEPDTEAHAWDALAGLLAGGASDGLLLDVGTLATHAGARYNVRVLAAEGRVLLIRPKLALADDGNYRESRWFSAWPEARGVETFRLPPALAAVTGQADAPFGHAILQLADARLACESCEELFTPRPPHAALALAGVDVVGNGSGSHHQLRKLHTRLDLVRGATAMCGGVYLYSNQRGCDGGRLYYDGCASVCVNGALVAQGAQFGLAEVEVVTAVVDLDAVAAFRGARASARAQAAGAAGLPPVIDATAFALCGDGDAVACPSPPIPPTIHTVEEEIAYGPACWLWDYLRRSGAGGFLLPLSGGADSAAVAAIVFTACRLVADAAAAGDAAVAADARRVARLGEGEEVTAKGLARKLLTTVYMASSAASGAATRARAAALAAQIGARHMELAIDGPVRELLAAATGAVGCGAPRFKVCRGKGKEEERKLSHAPTMLPT
jgi:NAD+ synthase (glutamine-hydrolysing)